MTSRRLPVSRAALSLWLAALLLWQTLGQVHGVLHAPALRGHATAAAAQAGAPLLVALVGHHTDDSVCRLIDQLGGGHAFAPALPLLPVVLPAVCVWSPPLPAPATRRVTPFDARGPPAFR